MQYLQETIWFVPTARLAAQLLEEGVQRGRIWTARDLRDLICIGRATANSLKSIARLKAAFGGEIIEVIPDRRASDAR